MKKVIFYLSLLLLIFLMGCASSSITSTWKSPDALPANYEKLMVIGIIREPDRNLRVSMEKHLVDDLKRIGYQAFSAYNEYGPGEFKKMSEEQATAKLKNDGVDAVLTVVLLDKQKERNYVPGRVMYTPYFTYHDRFWRYYHSIYFRIDEPGYYEYSTRYFWESNLYDLKTDKLIYSVQTQSFEPSTAESLAHDYSQKIINAMIRDNVVMQQPGKTARAY